jgi:membrane protease YdiL (CAAX protease family)
MASSATRSTVVFFASFLFIPSQTRQKSKGFYKAISTPDFVLFENTVGFTRYFFLVPLLLLAPFIEEVVNRGFLYKAFRGSYSLEISMALLVVLAIITHWQQCHNSPSATFSLSVLTIVQCYLREKSGSLWDCILCHFVFNASLLFIAVFLS